MAVADTFDALTANRAYHNSRSVVETLHLLKDACGYDFDLTVVVAMTEWVEGVAQKLGITVDGLTTGDLLAAVQIQDTIPLPDACRRGDDIIPAEAVADIAIGDATDAP